ncbi:MAG: PTS sugar transporter subunit IIA, partial [Verrucomicrobiota bacterium]
MRLDKYIARSRVVELSGTDLKSALGELLDASIAKFPDLKKESLLRGLLQRESTMTTYLGLGVSLPHVRVKMGRRYVLAIGRSRQGIAQEGSADGEKIHVIVMLLA